MDLSFALLIWIHHRESSHDAAEAAHLDLLAAHYLSAALTPPPGGGQERRGASVPAQRSVPCGKGGDVV